MQTKNKQTIKLILFAIGILVCINCHTTPEYKVSNDCTVSEISDEKLISSWRQYRVSIEEIEELSNGEYKEWDEWSRFVSRIHEMGDAVEIWAYCSPPNTWESLMGSKGYAVYKDKKLVEYIAVFVN